MAQTEPAKSLDANHDFIPKSNNKEINSVFLLEKSCDAKIASSCIKLGYLYQKGEIVNQDNVRSQSYFHLGCSYGNTEGCDNQENDVMGRLIYLTLVFLPIILPYAIPIVIILFSFYAWKKANRERIIDE